MIATIRKWGNNQRFILFEYIKSIDSRARKLKIVEQLPKIQLIP